MTTTATVPAAADLLLPDDAALPVDWAASASCAGADPDAWYPVQGSDGAEARAICARCPVRRACLTAAMREEAGMSLGYRHGIRGGLSPQQRRALDPSSRPPRSDRAVQLHQLGLPPEAIAIRLGIVPETPHRYLRTATAA